ncbi:MAG: AAA family ATPase [Deltaproteobacteria bacterium]|jgi:hypothetical protein|nr:AAA family ATPase [Deltaproteobacteria bacterium]
MTEFDDAASLLDGSWPEAEWLLPGILPQKSLVVSASPSGTGKGWFGLEACACLASGHEFHGRATPRPCRTVWISYEEREQTLKARLSAIMRDWEPAERALFRINFMYRCLKRDPRLVKADRKENVVAGPANWEALDAALCEWGPEVAFVDTYSKMFPLETNANELAAAATTMI